MLALLVGFALLGAGFGASLMPEFEDVFALSGDVLLISAAVRRSSPPAGTTPVTGERDGRLVGRTGRADPDVLAEQARRLAAAHLAEHGRPISRDALRRALRISNQVASQLLRSVNAQSPFPQPAGQAGTDGQDGRRPDREAVVPVPVVPPVAAAVGPERDGHRG